CQTRMVTRSHGHRPTSRRETGRRPDRPPRPRRPHLHPRRSTTAGGGRMRPFKFEWLEAVTREPRLTLSERTVATALGLYANADGTHAHPGVDRLARHLSCSERTVRRALVSIEKLGFIVLRSHGSR